MGKGEGSGEGTGQGAGDGGRGEGAGNYKGKTERVAVPAMPMPMAVICCVLNFLIPGFGTIIAGFSAFCCSRNEDIDSSARCVSCLMNLGIGCAQFITFALCLIGWCWSCAWGIFFIGMSAEYYSGNQEHTTDGYAGRTVQPSQGVTVIHTSATVAPHPVVTQPGMYPPAVVIQPGTHPNTAVA